MTDFQSPVDSKHSEDSVLEHRGDIHPTFPGDCQEPYHISRPALEPTLLSPYEDDMISKDEEIIQDQTASSYKVYKRRYYVLLLYSLILFYQCTIWNNWGPISASALEAFPNWTDATVATLANWGPITAVVFVVPISWTVDKWGIRPVTVVLTLLVALGHGLRCIPVKDTTFTVFAHVCGILNGAEYSLILAGATLPAVWFPAEQRITATAFSTALNAMGSAGSFLQPLLVRAPGNNTTPEEIRGEIRTLMFIEMGIAVGLFLAVVAYFPSSPPTPPSPSSQVERYNFSDGYRETIKNSRFWQLIVPYGIFSGVAAVWIGVIDFSLADLGIDQNEAMWIGVYGSICSGLFTLAISRLADTFYGHIKKALFVLMTTSAIFFIWFLLMTLNVIPSSKAQVYITVLGGMAFNYACTPLFYEVCVETVYPSPESGVVSIATLLNNLVAAIFLFLFYIPGISDNGNKWMIYALVASNVIAIPPVMVTKMEYKRSKLDRKELSE